MMSQSTLTPSKEYEIPNSATDGISCISFSPVAEYLAGSSWDGQVRVWQINTQAFSGMGGEAAIPVASLQHGPSTGAGNVCASLGCTWSPDGTKVFSAGTDKQGKMLDLTTQQTTQVAQHDAPISSIKFMQTPQAQMLVTGSWDKTIKYWDLRSGTPALTVNLPERLYCMDIRSNIFVVCTASTDRKILIYDLNNPSVVFKEMESPLKYQTRCVSCFSVGDGFALGSIEGRVAIQYLQEQAIASKENFSFKCHREKDGTQVFAVNAISFHPTYGTFSTAGSDGTFNFWDKDSKQRLKPFPKGSQPISATAFNRTGALFAYASSYDWSKGYEHYNPQTMKNSIIIHPLVEDEIKPRPKK